MKLKFSKSTRVTDVYCSALQTPTFVDKLLLTLLMIMLTQYNGSKLFIEE